MKIMAMIISKIIPGAWGALQSHDPQDPNQSQSKPKKVPVEGGPLVSYLASSLVLYSHVLTSIWSDLPFRLLPSALVCLLFHLQVDFWGQIILLAPWRWCKDTQPNKIDPHGENITAFLILFFKTLIFLAAQLVGSDLDP